MRINYLCAIIISEYSLGTDLNVIIGEAVVRDKLMMQWSIVLNYKTLNFNNFSTHWYFICITWEITII